MEGILPVQDRFPKPHLLLVCLPGRSLYLPVAATIALGAPGGFPCPPARRSRCLQFVDDSLKFSGCHRVACSGGTMA